MDKADNLLLASIDDKYDQAEQQYVLGHTAFLDVRERALVEDHLRSVEHITFGGYEDAERVIVLFVPDYMSKEDAMFGEDSPLCILRVSYPKGSRALTHRDYLGSLLSLGIDRCITGDILVSEYGADIIVLKSMAEFLQREYAKAGRTNLSCQLVPIGELDLGTQSVKEKGDTVASLRLDNLVASAFNLSRTKAQEAISKGIVFVNNIICEKSDMQIDEGSKITLRGKGKAVLKQIGNKTRKDRIYIDWELYI